MIGKFIFWMNDRLTRKDFSHKQGDLMFTVANPDDFFEQAGITGFDPFLMCCLQSYVQLDDGRWSKGLVFPFENSRDMKKAGIVEIEK